MTFQYRFTHTCGHTGFGPIVNMHIDTTQPSPTTSSLPAPDSNTTTIPLKLDFSCPFCNPSASYFHSPVTPGSGLLTILNSIPTSPFPTCWTILKAYRFEDLEPRDWERAFEGMMLDGRYRQMAWIPKPCGEVRLDGLDGGREAVKAGTSWRYTGRVDQIGNGRFAGLLSSLHKAVLERG
ncbi:hypothetical protein BKA64DRAFT_284734 [Cadophora sp. MPI-SDFR-AT-0126]|nr:hypothetical protein BKA64DRAFT_284734 [Leotiomycetes sp. MPI-SDFR-AT-0126]